MLQALWSVGLMQFFLLLVIMGGVGAAANAQVKVGRTSRRK